MFFPLLPPIAHILGARQEQYLLFDLFKAFE